MTVRELIDHLHKMLDDGQIRDDSVVRIELEDDYLGNLCWTEDITLYTECGLLGRVSLVFGEDVSVL